VSAKRGAELGTFGICAVTPRSGIVQVRSAVIGRLESVNWVRPVARTATYQMPGWKSGGLTMVSRDVELNWKLALESLEFTDAKGGEAMTLGEVPRAVFSEAASLASKIAVGAVYNPDWRKGGLN